MVFSTALLDFRNKGEAQGLLGQILGNYIDELDCITVFSCQPLGVRVLRAVQGALMPAAFVSSRRGILTLSKESN